MIIIFKVSKPGDKTSSVKAAWLSVDAPGSSVLVNSTNDLVYCEVDSDEKINKVMSNISKVEVTGIDPSRTLEKNQECTVNFDELGGTAMSRRKIASYTMHVNDAWARAANTSFFRNM